MPTRASRMTTDALREHLVVAHGDRPTDVKGADRATLEFYHREAFPFCETTVREWAIDEADGLRDTYPNVEPSMLVDAVQEIRAGKPMKGSVVYALARQYVEAAEVSRRGG